jgi:hypothetical protein
MLFLLPGNHESYSADVYMFFIMPVRRLLEAVESSY